MHEVRADLRRASSANRGVLEIARPCWRKRPLAKDICEGVEAVHTAVRIDDMVDSAITARRSLASEPPCSWEQSLRRSRPLPNA
jgi:hypothetical protein